MPRRFSRERTGVGARLDTLLRRCGLRRRRLGLASGFELHTARVPLGSAEPRSEDPLNDKYRHDEVDDEKSYYE